MNAEHLAMALSAAYNALSELANDFHDTCAELDKLGDGEFTDAAHQRYLNLQMRLQDQWNTLRAKAADIIQLENMAPYPYNDER